MAFEPYLRPAGDGTLELLVPSVEGTIHVLPYCFHTEEDAANWLASRKGREYMRRLRRRYGRRGRVSDCGAVSAGTAVP
jgi:TRAP-type C4-dicarboxylate transport system substrate-binding protein